MDSEKEYIEYLSSLDDDELEKETKEIYDDCVFYNILERGEQIMFDNYNNTSNNIKGV